MENLLLVLLLDTRAIVLHHKLQPLAGSLEINISASLVGSVVILDGVGQAIDVLQRRAQVMRHGLGEGVQVLVYLLQLEVLPVPLLQQVVDLAVGGLELAFEAADLQELLLGLEFAQAQLVE